MYEDTNNFSLARTFQTVWGRTKRISSTSVNRRGATAGNLSVQLDKLSEAGYIAVEKGFKGKKPCTTCRVTEAGISAFSEYVAALMDYIT